MNTVIRATLAWLVTVALWGQAGPVREIESTPDPVGNGQQVYTVRIKPGETRTYDLVTFACAYRQEFVRQTAAAAGSKTVNEPAAFTYRRKNVRLVDDLDTYISFRVPMGIRQLQDIYGRTTFHTNALIAISHITITAFVSEHEAWSFDVAASGLHAFEEAAPPHVPAKP